MTDSIDAFKKILKDKGLKATPQRVAVHEAMISLGHASADQVGQHIAQNSPVKITVSSVYNILTQMSGLGIYAQRMSANNKMYFDVTVKPHIHLYDKTSNNYLDIEDKSLMEYVTKELGKKKFTGYKVDSIEIHIVCHPTRKPRCSKA